MSLTSFLASTTLLLNSTSQLPRLSFLLHALTLRRLARQILHSAQYSRLRRRGCVLRPCITHLLQARLPSLFARLVAKGRGDCTLSVLRWVKESISE
jgi:hypothetical protein